MKKILLIMTIFILLSGIICGEELDMNRILPKKLTYSELPEDYPKELEELFIFYWDTVKEMERWDHIPYSEFQILWKNYISSMGIKKSMRIAYLIWLAKNSIPEYYEEYCYINGNELNIENNALFKWSDVSSITIYPPDKLPLLGQRCPENYSLPSIEEINGKIENVISSDKTGIDEQLILGAISLWLKVKIIDTELILDDHFQGNRYYLKVKVLDSFGHKFSNDNIIIQLSMFRSSRKINIGDEYLINAAYVIDNAPLHEELKSNRLECDYQCYYTAVSHRAFHIENENLIPLGTYPYKFLKEHYNNNGYLEYQLLENEHKKVLEYLLGGYDE